MPISKMRIAHVDSWIWGGGGKWGNVNFLDQSQIALKQIMISNYLLNLMENCSTIQQC